MRALLLILCCAQLLATPTLWGADSWIWWEGENPSSSNIPATTWLSPSGQSERDALSGGNIRTAVSIKTTGPYWANYAVTVAQAGTYRLYARKIWQYGPFKWRFDSAAWSFADSQLQLIDSTDYKPYFPLNWVYLGDVTLAAGAHTFRVEMNVADWSNEPDNIRNADFGGFDAFILSTQPFNPRGKLKPGQKYNLAEPGKWNFEAPADDFSPAALLDLRSLNERVAGQSGYVRVAGDQSGKYVLGDGTPVRFWGVNVGNWASDFASLSQQARFLAKRGVNLVRFHHQLPTSDPNNMNAVDSTYLEGAHRTVAAFKQEGIYTQFSLFWELPFTIRKEWGVDGYTADKEGQAAILMFDEKLKAAYKEWVRQLFTATNSYTGLSLAQDPAVAIIEIQNESSFFWWAFDPTTLPQAQREKLEAKFGAFLIGKYGSIAAANAAWGNVSFPSPYNTDAPASGRMALAGAWYMTASSTESWFLAYTPRIADQIQFLTELERAFYEEIRDYYRNTLGCQSLIASCNWTTADERILLDAERYAYTANDVMDKHPYFSPVLVDPDPPGSKPYGVLTGDYYQSLAVVKNPRSLPAAYKKVAGFPHHASESTWVDPNRFKAEGPLLVAAYSSMSDVSGWVWFQTSALAYDDNANQVSVPSLMGQFPGAALLYRRGDVAEAPVAVREERNLSRLYHKELALISEFDPSRNPPDNPVYDPLTGTGRIDPLAMLVGKVECNYGTSNATSYVSPLLFSQMDMANRTVESLPAPANTNGQLKLDWGKGLFRVNSPRSQGAAGFLNSVAEVDLDDVTITSSNEFGSILVIALDNLPIAQSQKILIQAMTEDNPYHWQEQDQVFTNNNVVYTGKKIVSMGQPPMNVVNIAGAVTFNGLVPGHSFAVRVLDENGYDRGNGNGQIIGSDLNITLPANSLYTVVVKDVNSAPVLVAPPDQAIKAGQTLTVTNYASDPDLPANQLTFSLVSAPTGVQLDPATGVLAWTPTGTQLLGTNVIVVKVSDDGHPSLSATNGFTVILQQPPAITSQPQSQTAYWGQNVSFSVVASGPPPLSYQWQKNGTPIPGATSAVLTLMNVKTGDAGSYTVIVSNSGGLVTGAAANLTLLPVVVPWEHGQTVNGFQDDFNGPARDPNWKVRGSGGDYYKQQNGVLKVTVKNGDPNHLLYEAPGYDSSVQEILARVRVTAFGTGAGPRAGIGAAVGSGDSQGIDLLFRDFTQDGITGKQFKFLDDIRAWGPPGLKLDWKPHTWYWMRLRQEPDAVGATADVLAKVWLADGVALEPDQWQLTWDYFPTRSARTGFAGITGSTWSGVGQGEFEVDYILIKALGLPNLTVDTNPGNVPPSISLQPQSQAVNPGETVIFSAAAIGTSPLSYQWLKNGSPVAGATNLTLTLNNVQSSQAGNYSLMVANAAGSTNSVAAVLTVMAPPAITFQPQSQTLVAGATAILSVAATGTAPLSYQWQVNGTNLTDNGRLTGSQSNLLTMASVLVGDAGNYEVIVTNAYGSATSAVATLTVLQATPVVTWTNPAAITYGTVLGSNQLNATASVPGTFAYEPPAHTGLDAGTATLSAIFTPSDPVDFNRATAIVSVVVVPAPLSVSADSATRLYGQDNPVFTGAIVGLVIGDNISADYRCAATPTSLPGDYPIVPSLVDPNNQRTNYQVALVNGALTVTPAAPPTIVSVMPNTGPTNGGTIVTILGTAFTAGATVNFGALPAASLKLITPTNLTAVTLPSTPGTVDVVLTNADGQSVILTNGFTYVAPPVFLEVTRTGGTITFTWSATPGQTYQAQYKTNLSQLNWTDLVILTATNSTATAAEAPNPDTQRFYRINWLPW